MINTLTIENTNTLQTEDSPPQVVKAGDELYINFQLDLLIEMLSGGATQIHNIEVVAIPTFGTVGSYKELFSGWWATAPFTITNPFALEQLTGLPAGVSWGTGQLMESQEILVAANDGSGKVVAESGAMLIRSDGSQSWFKNGTDRPPETLAELSSQTLTLRDGSKSIFAGGGAGYMTSSLDPSQNVTTYQMAKELGDWGNSVPRTITDAYGRSTVIGYSTPQTSGERTFTLTDPWGAVTTITWEPAPGIWSFASSLPTGYPLWKMSSAPSWYTVSNGGTLTVLNPDPDGSGPRKALEDVYTFGSDWFLTSVTSGPVGETPVQNYSFGYDYDPNEPSGEIGSRGLLSITFNSITTTVDFARRRQDLAEFWLSQDASIVARAYSISSPGQNGSPFYDITSVTDGRGNRTLLRMDHRGRIYQSMDAYYVNLLGLNTLDLSDPDDLKLAHEALQDHASITTQYVLWPTFRDAWGRVTGEDRGEVLALIGPDPDDFTLRTDLPVGDRVNGNLPRPVINSQYSEGNRILKESPLLTPEEWDYNDQFDIPTRYLDETGISYVQTIDTAVGKVDQLRVGYFGWNNFLAAWDVNGSGSVTALDALIVTNYINANGQGQLPPVNDEGTFIDVTGDGFITNSDVAEIIDFINANGAGTPVSQISLNNALQDYEYSTASGMPRGLLTKQTVLNGHSTNDTITEYEYYNTPGYPETHGMLHYIIEAPNTSIEAITTFNYDSRANVSEIVDSAGRSTKFFYDNLDRQTAVIYPDPDGTGPLVSAMIRYDYDVFGNLIATEIINSAIDEAGATVYTSLVDGFTFDAYNRLTGSYQQDPDLIWYVTSITSSGVARSTTRPSSVTQLDIASLAAANPLISTSSTTNSSVTPANDSASRGMVTTYTYDDNHNLLTAMVSDAGSDPRTTTFVYDEADRPILTVTPDPGGSEAQGVSGETRNANSAHGEIDGYVFSTIFDNTNQVWRSTNTQGLDVDIRYDQLGRPVSITVPGPNGGAELVSAISYEAANGVGWSIKETDPQSRSTITKMDFRGNVIQVVLPDSTRINRSYYSDGNLKSVTDPDMWWTLFSTYDYDERGRLKSVTDAQSNTTSYQYGVDSRLASVTDPLGRTSSFSYDLAGRMSTSTAPDPDGTGSLAATSQHYVYDSLGNLTQSKHDLSDGTRLTRDARFRIVKSRDAGDVDTLFQYDVFGNMTSVEDAKANTTTFAYDRLNRLYQETKGSSGSRTSYIDGANNVQKVVDRNGRITRYEYDDLYRLTKEIWGDVNAVVREISFSYDDVGNLLTASDTDLSGTTPVTASDDLTFVYDARDRVDVEMIENPLLGDSVIFDNSFNRSSLRTAVVANIGGNLSGTTISGGATDFTTNYYYDSRHLLSSIVQSGSSVADKSARFSYNAAGQLSDLKRYNSLGTQDLAVHSRYGYDEAGRLSSITHASQTIGAGESWDGTSTVPSSLTSTSLLAAYFLEYDQANRLVDFSSFQDGFDATYSYDDRDQLTAASYAAITGLSASSLPSAESYAFDETGNRELSGNSTSTDGSHNRVQNDGTYTYQYDNEGNQTSRTEIATSAVTNYEYDYRNRLVKVTIPGKTVHYQYDVFDRRTGKEVDTGSNGSIDNATVWIWDGDQVALQLEDADGDGSQPFELSNRYLYGDTVDMLLADEQITVDPYGGSSEVLWPLADHLGSIRDLVELVNGNIIVREHQVYDAFGNVIQEVDRDASGTIISSSDPDAVDTLFGYTGREWDADVGLQYNRARWYDPATGRWISQDPIGFNAGDANLYRYVGNGPTIYVDPSGLDRSWPGLIWDWTFGWILPTSEQAAEATKGALSIANHRNNFAQTNIRQTIAVQRMLDPKYGVGQCEPSPPAGQIAGSSQGLDEAKPGIKLLATSNYQIQAAAAGIVGAASPGRFIFDPKTKRFRDTTTGRFVAARDLPWPPSAGFASSSRQMVPAGKILDRYGSSSGRFLAEQGASISERGMAPGSECMTYTRYRVLKQFEAQVGPAAPVPAFGASGGAIQYLPGRTIQWLIDNGYLEVLK